MTSTAEAVVFWVLGAVALMGAIGVVAAPKAVYSAIFLASTMISRLSAQPGGGVSVTVRLSLESAS